MNPVIGKESSAHSDANPVVPVRSAAGIDSSGGSPEPSLGFGLLQPARRPWWTVAVSFGGQALAVAALVWVGAPMFAPRLQPMHQSLLRFDLAAPPVVPRPRPHPHITPPPPREMARLERTPVPRPEPIKLRPQPTLPTPRVKPVPEPPVVKPVPRPAEAKPVRPAPAPVKMGVFDANEAKATVHRPARTVQTGGFGSAAGVNSHAFGPANVPRLGGFDMAEGAGHGNGHAGARGTPGVVASAGFGSGVAAGTPGRPHGVVSGVSFGDGVSAGTARSRGGSVQASGFDAQAAPAGARRSGPARAVTTPLEVLYKPRPAYTQEARDLHLEGTVLLSAVFPANGPVRVLRVMRGLGHGLDQSAIRAAEQIRFKPKQINGQAVDTTATLAIVFQLAY